MPTYTEAAMRAALEAEIKGAAPAAVVFSWWNLSGDDRTWPGKLTPTTGADAGKVHGYVITRRRTYAERYNPACVRRFFTYQIRGLRFHETGNRTANSDLAYNAELDAICERFANKSSLPDAIRRIAESSELDFTIDLNLYGSQILHRAVGSITIEQC
jgi:hypothetical protein